MYDAGRVAAVAPRAASLAAQRDLLTACLRCQVRRHLPGGQATGQIFARSRCRAAPPVTPPAFCGSVVSFRSAAFCGGPVMGVPKADVTAPSPGDEEAGQISGRVVADPSRQARMKATAPISSLAPGCGLAPARVHEPAAHS
jgi:hypothetical protein